MHSQVGQALGAVRPLDARRSVIAGFCLAGCALVVLAAAILLIPRPLASIFSSDSEVLDKFVEVRLPHVTVM